MAASLQLDCNEKAKLPIHYVESSFGVELDLHKHFGKCPKNPGHNYFIPVSKFSKFYLPLGHQTDANCTIASYLANLTVKLSIQYVSPHRPPGYVLSDYGGQYVATFGSGYLYNIFGDKSNSRIPCPIRNCPKHAGPHDVFGYFSIFTAAHVVFDDLEAGNTSVEFFYDDSVDKRRLKVAEGVKVGTKSVEGDFLELLCVTHDKSLFDDITLLHTGSDLTFMPRLRTLTTRLVPHFSRNNFWIMPLGENLNKILNSDFSNERFMSSLLHLEEFSADSLLSEMFCLLTYVLKHCKRRSTEHASFEHFIKFFISNLKGMIFIVVDVLLVFHKESLGLPLAGITVAGIGTMDEVKETVIILKKIEILFQRRRCHKLLDENMQTDLSSFFRLLNSFIQCRGYLVNINYESHNQNALHLIGEEKPLIIAISHPHGQSKQMTFGSFITCDTSSGYYKHIYNNPTCNGGSGAPVWVIPSESKKNTEEVYGILHKGHHGNELNEGSAWTLYLPFGDRLCLKQESCIRLLTAFVDFLDSSSIISDAFMDQQLCSDASIHHRTDGVSSSTSTDSRSRALTGQVYRSGYKLGLEAAFLKGASEPSIGQNVDSIVKHCARSVLSYFSDWVLQKM